MIRRAITVHISPYVGGLAPETHDFVRYLNEEAKRLRSGVSFIALANRILVRGNLGRLATTLGGWLLRDALAAGYVTWPRRPAWRYRDIDRQTDLEIESEKQVLRRGNSQHRKELRRLEKNRPQRQDYRYPRQRIALSDAKRCVRLQGDPERRPSDSLPLDKLVEIAGETLYHLICAIPLLERDGQEIYPADFSVAFVPLHQQTNWPWRWADECVRAGEQCGVGVWAAPGYDTLGLHDYSEPVRLLFKYGRYELVTRQKAASPVRYVLIAVPSNPRSMAELTAALWPWEQLTPPETQRALERIGRLYKNSCWWSKKEKRRLFDKAEASSWKKLQIWKPGQRPFEWDPTDLETIEKREARGGRVLVGPADAWDQPFWLRSQKRHADLENTRAAYNEKYESYLNSAGLGKRLRGSLNIPREAQTMIEKVKNNFGQSDQEQVA
jgi:hypothetical protein